MEWQNGFEQLADRALASTSRSQEYAAAEQILGRLVEASNVRYLAPELKRMIGQNITAKIDSLEIMKTKTYPVFAEWGKSADPACFKSIA
jgi:hypothetical protein